MRFGRLVGTTLAFVCAFVCLGIVLAVLLAIGVAPALVQKTVHVKGYTKKDGTVVKPHDWKAPGSSTATYPTTPQSPAPSPPGVSAPQQVPPAADQSSLSVVFVVGGAPATALYDRALCPWLKVSGAVLATYR